MLSHPILLYTVHLESNAKSGKNSGSDTSDVKEKKKCYISEASGVINNGYAASTNSIATLGVNSPSLGESMLTVNYADIPGIHILANFLEIEKIAYQMIK